MPFLRLGRSSRIHPLIQDHAAETLTLDISSVDELTDFYSSYVSSSLTFFLFDEHVVVMLHAEFGSIGLRIAYSIMLFRPVITLT